MFQPNTTTRVMLKNLALSVVLIALSTAVYFVLPLGLFGEPVGTWGFIAVFAIGLLAVAILVARQVRRYQGGFSLVGVAVALTLAVLFFSSVYYGLALHTASAFTSLRTKIDALYFTLTLTSTVGFGDVHAVSQLARAVVTVNMAFNLVFLGAAISLVRTSSSRRRS